ncbi:hypothetical protein [Ferroplasma sp.]|uniref:hypothetical protein n=1 Tax=Ferroplasma sp. TaxID=2591003 RepID=UPI00307F924D
MNTDVVPLRLDKTTLTKIDKMVEAGIFNSRNAALNIIIKTGIKNFDFWNNILSISNSYDQNYDDRVSLRLNNALNKFLKDRDRF